MYCVIIRKWEWICRTQPVDSEEWSSDKLSKFCSGYLWLTLVSVEAFSCDPGMHLLVADESSAPTHDLRFALETPDPKHQYALTLN